MRLSPKCKSIISGEAEGVFARVLRMILTVGAWAYSLIIRFRNRLYDMGWLKSYKLPVPVICVGNITTGGTGKTPVVEFLGGYLQKRGVKVALLSRGYQAQSGGDNDEISILRERLAGVTMVIDSDRVRGGRRAIAEHGAEVLLLDDGFQHRRLKRDLDIVLIDCTCPFGYGWLLP
ncbi:MAG: tetraacyldisaccharide 4'-kinase, partial [Sedimentisphaerales bacterium]|nr:tetraacyldisaccharide 4'-kinase [Sedimentisphaerales bacterium]